MLFAFSMDGRMDLQGLSLQFLRLFSVSRGVFQALESEIVLGVKNI
jgi:hypothetical protein